MNRPIPTLLAAFTMSGAAGAAGTNCDLVYPPRESGTNANHGVIYYVFPRKLVAEYSGCQTMWDEKGRKVWIVEFKDGEPTDSTMINPDDSTESHCTFRGGKVVGKNQNDCPEYGWLKRGLPTVRAGTEPHIPPDRDPRR